MRTPLVLALIVLSAAASHAQTREGERARPGARTEQPAEAARKPPSLDELFERLAKAGAPQEARAISGQIERRWLRSGSDTADLLMTRAIEAMKVADHPLAIELLDRITVLRPNWAEAWNKRGMVFLMMGDATRARVDFFEAVKREPRHYGALFGLASVSMRNDDKKAAYAAYKRVEAIHPQFPSVKEMIERLRPEVEGREI